MSKINQAILFISHFSLGLVLPVLNLIFLDRGATLQTLPLLYMIMAITVLCLELPSGICADLMGRKNVFLISCVLNFVSFFLLIFAKNNLAMLIVVIVLYGMGRAFASGSLDALIIDQTLASLGNDHLPMITTRLSIIEGVGLSLGSIAGGLLAQVSATRTINLLCRSVLILAVLVLSYLFIKEDKMLKRADKPLPQHVSQGLKLLFKNRSFGFVIFGGLFVGLLLASVETYWQPAFEAITTNAKTEWLLGFITFFGFLSVTLGNKISQKLLEKCGTQKHFSIYLISRGILATLMIIFALQKSTIGFIIGYTGIYLLLGVSNISESTLINRYAPNYMRASVLSMSSLITQIGLLCSALICSLAIKQLHFSGIWIVMACLIGGYVIFVALFVAWYKKQNKETEVRNVVEIVNAREYQGGLDKAVDYIHGVWGSDNNYPYYSDAIYHSSLAEKHLPMFFLLLKNNEIIGCSALITNDFISRHDLYPWIACLFVDEKERGQEYGNLLMEHAEKEARNIGFSVIYLTTDHDGYYEKYGWHRIEDGVDLFSGQPSRIYAKQL